MYRANPFCRAGLLAMLVVLCLAPAEARKKQLPAVRWTKDAPGCEFQSSDDGRYRWRMLRGDTEMTLIMDSQELSKTRHRLYHVLGAYLTVTYNGKDKLDFPADVSLEFVRHHHVIEGFLDPNEFSTRMQNDADSLVFVTERDIKKHPDKSEEKLARAREYEKEVSEFIEFLSTQSLQPATLNPGNPEAHGWLFFGTRNNKWIGPLKNREDFVVRVKMKSLVWEFPFSLPPHEGELILRKRD